MASMARHESWVVNVQRPFRDAVEVEKKKTETEETLAKLAFEGQRCPVCDGIMVPMNVSLPRLRASPGETNA